MSRPVVQYVMPERPAPLFFTTTQTREALSNLSPSSWKRLMSCRADPAVCALLRGQLRRGRQVFYGVREVLEASESLKGRPWPVADERRAAS